MDVNFITTKAKRVSNKQAPMKSKVVNDFPIVGIGASAGGLEAFRALLEYLPADTGLAFVIIQHLAAGQESMLPDILSRFTTIPVHQVSDGLKVEPDNVYVIPPGTTMTLSKGTLKLSPKGKSLRPIDDFLRSLAVERKTQAIGIVLSGTGSDGTEGLKVLRAEGGVTFAQQPKSAQYTGMPQNAILAEAVDFILSPEKIAKELSKISKNPHLIRSEIIAEPKITKETGLRKIFTLLKTSYNVDFSHYKDTVINRRVTRRMVINHIDKITDYADYLGTHRSELKALFDDLLIGVTSFFREPKTFETLKDKLLPKLLENRESKEPLRVWIPGCSTGEEAYSFAIAIQEFLEGKGPSDVQVQIFGTDVNEKNIDKARQGIYSKSIEADVSENRLKRFFISTDGNYQIAKFIRDKCVFAKQDITADPPFSNLDLISCRNMLIYFDAQLQEKIVPILHYALKPSGFLILGESESIGKFTTLFEQVFKKNFVYTKKTPQSHINFGVNFGFEPSAPQTRKTVPRESFRKDADVLLREEVDRLLITEYVPAAMLINSNLDILVFRGNVTPYLSPESGQTSLNVTKILRKELRSEVQTLVYRAKKDNKPVAEEAIRFQSGEIQKTVNIQVIPLKREEPFFLILVEDVSSAAAHLRKTIELTASPAGRENVKDTQIRELREELESSKQTLQRVVENQEATNEELRSAMEEVQSSNEELQSTNEELETAKEELQSSNEELTTLNDELKNRNQALGILSDNQANLNRNVDPAVVMVDGSLKIKLFTPSAQKILNLVPTDAGLPLSNVHLAISVPNLEKTILDVIKSLGSEIIKVSDEKGRFYELRIRPYVTEDNRIDGAVLSFIDVNELRQHENKLQKEETKYRTLAENSPDIIARFDRNARYLYVNVAIEKLTGIPAKNFIGKTAQEVGMPKNLAEAWSQSVQNTIKTGKASKGEMEVPAPEGPRIAQFVIVPEFSVAGNIETVLVISRDETELKKSEEALKKSQDEYRSLFSNMIDGFAFCRMIFDKAGKPVDWVYLEVNDAFERITDLKREVIIGQKVSEVIPGIKEANPEIFELYGRVVRTGKEERFEYLLKPLNLWLRISVYSPNKGYFAAVLEDISESKKAQFEREIMVEFLRIANGTTSTHELVKAAVDFFQKQCGCEAVGIRLKEGDEYPYYVTRGFPPEHIRLENQICARNDAGYIVRDSKGNPIIECMCGNVISGRFDPSKEFFTEKGSFWTNNTTLLLATTTAESRGNTRNCCNREGYESIALIPLAIGDTRLGLLQLNDHRKGMFTLETIQIWERIADRLATALARNISEEALSISLEQSRLRESEILALLKASRAVLQNKDFQDSAKAIFNDAKELIGATAGYVALLDKEGKNNDVLFLEAGLRPCTVDPSLPMPIRGLRAEAYKSGKAVVENDFAQSQYSKFMPKGHVQLDNVLFAPLTIEKRVLGVIGLANKNGDFTERDREMAMAFGEIASVALANSIMLEKLEEKEKELKTYSENLEKLVEERTKQLKDSERLAAIGTVAGMVGHDIRNPLQAISGDVYLAKTYLASSPDSEEKKNVEESLMEIEKNAEYIHKIVADLQEFAKPPEPKLEEIDIEQILDSTLATIKIPENIAVIYPLAKVFPKIKADPTYLQRILINLTNNAIQAMPNGGKLTISATCSKGKAIIAIHDTGEGIPENVKNKIFTPLMTTKAKGQGFGLAAVKRFTEAMGGTVTFVSEDGKGTKFIVELPL